VNKNTVVGERSQVAGDVGQATWAAVRV